MADKKISQLTSATTPLVGTEVMPIVQSGATVKTPVSNVITASAGYTPDGTGAVARSVASKLQESVSVKDFGAVGDGVADDTAAFSDAFDTGKAVYAPEGTYLLNFLNVPSNTFLFGDGANTVIKPLTDDTRCALGADSGSSSAFIENIIIRDVKFLGNVVSAGFSEQKHLTSFNGVKNLLIENCQFIGFRGDGVYIGSGNNGGEERHNVNVTVRGCFFDGVNKDNRNGISVIDCDGFLADGNYFTRCTRSNMPGAIDIEPDASVFHIVKDIKVVNNKFYDIGGNVGAVSVYLPGVVYTTAPRGFHISGNYIDTCTASGAFFSYNVVGGVTEATVDFAVTITENTVVSANRPFNVSNGKDIKIKNNSFISCTQEAIISYNGGEKVTDCEIETNLFKSCGSASGNGLSLFTCSRVTISDNTFNDCGTGVPGAANAIQFNTGTSSSVSITNNRFVSPTGKTLIAIQKEAGHTFTTSTNIFVGNSLGSLPSAFSSEYSDTSEQTYNPVVTGSTSAGTGTYTIQYGRWRRIGKIVFFRIKLSVSAGHTGTGMIQVTLPTYATSASNNEETTIALSASGVSTTGGHIGLINPALDVNSTGAVRCYYTGTGTTGQMLIPAGAFTLNLSGFYQAA